MRCPERRAFRAPGLPPADYVAIALPSVDRTGWQDPEFLQSLLPLATRVHVGEGGSATVRLTMVRRH